MGKIELKGVEKAFGNVKVIQGVEMTKSALAATAGLTDSRARAGSLNGR